MSTPVPVVMYTRISTDETSQPVSLGAQHDRIAAFLAGRPDWQIIAHYTDQASGRNLERPALSELRRAAVAGRFDLLLVCRVDRLSRNLGQLVSLIEEFAGEPARSHRGRHRAQGGLRRAARGTPPHGSRKPRGTSIREPDPATAPVVVSVFRH